jgi:hypothetical protein
MFTMSYVLKSLLKRSAGPRARLTAGLLAVASCLSPVSVLGQGPSGGRYFPLDQTTPPGVAGQWSTASRRTRHTAMQPIRVELPGEAGQVAFYTGQNGAASTFAAPADASIRIGSVYRLKLSEMPDFPGVELYPTVELLDGLHPPKGREAEFPVPITFTEHEIRLATQGRMITKVIYLEQPDRAAPVRNSTAARTLLAGPRENILALADAAGRPMAIVWGLVLPIRTGRSRSFSE